mgnify:CR=1 FL=1|jgi:predicted dehydrogenase
MIGVGILGIGFMGSAHFNAMRRVNGAAVVALATRDRTKWTGDWSNIRGNYGTPAGQVDLTGVSTYPDLTELVADPHVDLIDICLPTAQHRIAAIRALDAGKHVLVEKPIALTRADAEEMQAAARANGRRLFVAHVLHFMEPYRHLREILERPETQPLGLTMSRHVSTPWRENAWRPRLEASGGPVLDLLIHDVDLIRSVLGLPRSVTAHGHMHEEYPVHYHALLDYGPTGPTVSLSGGITGMPGRPLQQRYTLHAEDLTLTFDPARAPQPVLTQAGHDPESMPTRDGDPIAAELQYVIDALAGRHDGSLLDAAGAADSLAICLATTRSITSGEIISICMDNPIGTGEGR